MTQMYKIIEFIPGQQKDQGETKVEIKISWNKQEWKHSMSKSMLYSKSSSKREA